MIIENYGTGDRCAETLRLLLLADSKGEITPSVKRCILLPIPTTRDKIHLSGTDKLLLEIFAEVKSGDLIAGYGIDEESKLLMRSLGAIVYDALDDEEFLAENAEETAIGALGYILSTSKKTPKDTRYAIVGYGRIGSRLVRLLLFLGGSVKVYTGSEKTSVSLGEYGIDASLVTRGEPLPEIDADILINTAPTDLSASFPTGKLPRGLRVIELASGENFMGVEGIERLPGIPDRSYGKSAGRTYFSRILEYAKEAAR